MPDENKTMEKKVLSEALGVEGDLSFPVKL